MEVPVGPSWTNDEWYAPYLNYASQKNISDNKNPSQKMSRGEVAEAIYRIMKIEETGASRYNG